MRQKANRQQFRQSNNRRELHKTGGIIPHSIFRHTKRGGVSYIPGSNYYPSNVALSAIPLTGGRIRRHQNFVGNGFFDNVGAWFKRLFTKSNANHIASNLLKKAVPFVTNLAGEILTDQALHANPLDTIKKHNVRNVRNYLNKQHEPTNEQEHHEKHEMEVAGGALKKSTNTRAKAAYKKYVKKTKSNNKGKKTGGAILTY